MNDRENIQGGKANQRTSKKKTKTEKEKGDRSEKGERVATG